MLLAPPLWATGSWVDDSWADGTWATQVVIPTFSAHKVVWVSEKARVVWVEDVSVAQQTERPRVILP